MNGNESDWLKKRIQTSYVLERIKKRREELGLSFEDMGRLLFVSRTAYDKIEKGKSKLTVDYLMNIAEILRISPLDLIKPDNEYHVVISKEDYDTLMAASALLAKMHDQIVPIKTETVSIDNAGGTIGQINFGNQNALGESKEKVAKKKSKV